MHNNAFVIARFADFLNKTTTGSLLSCVSTSSNDLHLTFAGKHYLLIRFVGNHTFFLNPEWSHFPKKNVLHQFKAISQLPIESVQAYTNDRGFYIQFHGSYQLHIQCFGRHSGVLLVNDGIVVDSFKNLKPDPEFQLTETSVEWSLNKKDFAHNNRFVDGEMINDLEEKGFFSSDDQQQFWSSYVSQLMQSPLYIRRDEKKGYALSLYASSDTIDRYADIAQALHDFARLYISKQRFEQLKQQLHHETGKQIKQLVRRLKKIESHINKLQSRTSYKDIADLIMANLYQIKPGTKEVVLDSFYSGKPEKIALKVDLSPQKNAERYYQKAKNSHLELDFAQKQSAQIKATLARLEERLNQIDLAETAKELQQLSNSLQKSEKKQKAHKELPYRSFSFHGFDIWVGKNAKSNDVLLKMAHRNDVWLHAREVAGSHVLIKNPEDRKLSDDLIEFAASLAAKFSKSKNDGLTAVIYTSPKFVRKFKGALPGQVKVDREEVVLVEPYSG